MAPASSDTAPARRPGRPRQDDPRAAEVRERLLDAATELTLEHGFDNCGLREIAARAEVSSGMIAYYFGDRRGLYDAMFTRALERVGAQVQRSAHRTSQPSYKRSSIRTAGQPTTRWPSHGVGSAR